MCAKIAQNHETKEERVKNPSKVLDCESLQSYEKKLIFAPKTKEKRL